jgi:pyruvate,water dikinase
MMTELVLRTASVTPNNQKINAELLGGKASSLLLLKSWGLPVPDFCCVTSTAFTKTLELNKFDDALLWLKKPSVISDEALQATQEKIRNCDIPNEIVEKITQFIDEHPESYFAVRSSGTLEDGIDASFAGLFETILNVKSKDDVVDALKNCWAALFAKRVVEYVQKQGITESMGLAIVIQVLVPAEKSGVCFSVDPVRGVDSQILIEACFGLGEALVAGQVTPDRYHYDWMSEQQVDQTISDKEVQCIRIPHAPFTKFEDLPTELSGKQVLSCDEVKRIADLALMIQAHTGHPVDIEWAQCGDLVYILQSRPITELSFTGIEGEWTTADYRDGGVSSSVCTPYMASLYKGVMDSAMTAYVKRLGLKSNDINDTWQQTFYGRPYWNLHAAKHYLSKVIGFNERSFDEGLGIEPTYEGNGIVSRTSPSSIFYGLRALLTIKRSCRRKLKTNPAYSLKQKQRLKQLNKIDLQAMSTRELFDFFKQFMTQDYFNNESIYFDFIYDNSSLNSIFKDNTAKLNFNVSEFTSLLSGLSNVSHMAQIEALWQVRDQILKADTITQYWLNSNVEKITADLYKEPQKNTVKYLKEFLNDFGHHAKHELDLLTPRYRERPEDVIKQIKEILQLPSKDDPRRRNKEQQALSQKARERLAASTPFWRRNKMLADLDQVRSFLWWREELRDLSTQFYYHVRKVSLELERRLLANGDLLNENDIFFTSLKDIVAFIDKKIDEPSLQALIKKNKTYYNCFSHYSPPDEIGQRYKEQNKPSCSNKDGYQGVGASPGEATGVARVIANLDDADRLQAGDILITRCTDPGWTAKFSSLSGVITETGGILSHAAVICREYGIPAVLAVKQATRNIKDGQTITIDGNSGLIFLPDVDLKQNNKELEL